MMPGPQADLDFCVIRKSRLDLAKGSLRFEALMSGL
jgi:hypothetical protein